MSPLELNFGWLQTRLIQLVQAHIRNGDYTERGLARILGISQPQMHHILKGARKLSPEIADRILSHLGIGIVELLDEALLPTATAVFRYAGDERAHAEPAAGRKPLQRATPPGSPVKAEAS